MGIPVFATDVGVSGGCGRERLQWLPNRTGRQCRYSGTALAHFAGGRPQHHNKLSGRDAAWNCWAERFNSTNNHRVLAQALQHELDWDRMNLDAETFRLSHGRRFPNGHVFDLANRGLPAS